MKALIQVVENAEVKVDGKVEGSIDYGMLIFLGVKQGDGRTELEELLEKVVDLRIFPDEEGKMNLSIKDVRGEILVVSQFTLYADVNSGRRPGFSRAGDYEEAKLIYKNFVKRLEESLDTNVESGKFGSHMKVELINDGPITFLVES
ncbi:D-tyrosyl-tRNA(Tyr) deacylase [Candidatus Bipolaricaulota bacterium]|nr:D-tyrosyl-tRNA(Tyr) deacylase [Candidatus Bipolaricaulota bacterium]